jgi:hypothetical protein
MSRKFVSFVYFVPGTEEGLSLKHFFRLLRRPERPEHTHSDPFITPNTNRLRNKKETKRGSLAVDHHARAKRPRTRARDARRADIALTSARCRRSQPGNRMPYQMPAGR